MYMLFLDETSRGNSREHTVLTLCIFQLPQSFVKEVWLCLSEYSFSLSGIVMCNCFVLGAFPLCSGIFVLDLTVVSNLELVGLFYGALKRIVFLTYLKRFSFRIEFKFNQGIIKTFTLVFVLKYILEYTLYNLCRGQICLTVALAQCPGICWWGCCVSLAPWDGEYFQLIQDKVFKETPTSTPANRGSAFTKHLRIY